ncbi:helix-turn-helix domain-containing protein [Methylomonas koyamae]|uniref:helix-turn-helix domain-containing protein n=1 Tax=Methylomonas koyamae TaxID=702114 RepID=UPI000BC35B91|nr:helix-turn-helix domain-containing protein [Methylomonas koyamae]ATG89305.1 helix-turn-helix domain-containing protein [Methylomonas koyamae]
MSIEYLNAAFQVRLMGTTKAVLVALADRVNRAGYCVASLDDIALRAGCSPRSAMRAVGELEALGLVVVVRDPGRANRYLLMVEKFSTTGDTTSPDFPEIPTTSDTSAPVEVIHTGDTVTKTSDISAKTRDTMSYKPYNQNNHNARAREGGDTLAWRHDTVSHNARAREGGDTLAWRHDTVSHNARAREGGAVHSRATSPSSGQPPGRSRLVGLAAAASGAAPPCPQPQRLKPAISRELTHIRALLLDNRPIRSESHD